MTDSLRQPPVLVVGGGPVGLTVASLLAAGGVSVLLVERNATTSDEAKAISLDDESLRTMQGAGLAEQVLEIVVPGTGTRYYDRRGHALFHARGTTPYRLGHPFKNQFAQPELERVLLQALEKRPEAEVRFATELVSLTDTPEGVTASLRSVDGGTAHSTQVDVGWVLGCDGGRSTVRDLKGIGMTGTSHRQVWLVADTVEDPHNERYGMHLGIPDRPTVIIPGRDGRCRYEFRLRPGEGEGGTTPDFETIRRLVAPYRAITPQQVERRTNYTFNAVIADRWRDGRCFLLGDAAHMMPPFAGQGLNSGIRDAANLSWKLAAVWHGHASERILDTYEPERRPHATAMVRYSERLGEVVMTTSRSLAFTRDAAIGALMLTPWGRRYLKEMRFRPRAVHTTGLVIRIGTRDDRVVGTQLPQPRVLVSPGLKPRLLDEVLGEGLALLGVDLPESAWDRMAGAAQAPVGRPMRQVGVVLGDRLPRVRAAGRTEIADVDGGLEAALGALRGRFVLLRPDRYVAAVFTPARAGSVIERLAAWFPRSTDVQPGELG
jgi:3-(3-hydroxy-phenyl)propionate hydroxylase